jgi:hypothetical protein
LIDIQKPIEETVESLPPAVSIEELAAARIQAFARGIKSQQRYRSTVEDAQQAKIQQPQASCSGPRAVLCLPEHRSAADADVSSTESLQPIARRLRHGQKLGGKFYLLELTPLTPEELKISVAGVSDGTFYVEKIRYRELGGASLTLIRAQPRIGTKELLTSILAKQERVQSRTRRESSDGLQLVHASSNNHVSSNVEMFSTHLAKLRQETLEYRNLAPAVREALKTERHSSMETIMNSAFLHLHTIRASRPSASSKIVPPLPTSSSCPAGSSRPQSAVVDPASAQETDQCQGPLSVTEVLVASAHTLPPCAHSCRSNPAFEDVLARQDCDKPEDAYLVQQAEGVQQAISAIICNVNKVDTALYSSAEPDVETRITSAPQTAVRAEQKIQHCAAPKGSDSSKAVRSSVEPFEATETSLPNEKLPTPEMGTLRHVEDVVGFAAEQAARLYYEALIGEFARSHTQRLYSEVIIAVFAEEQAHRLYHEALMTAFIRIQAHGLYAETVKTVVLIAGGIAVDRGLEASTCIESEAVATSVEECCDEGSKTSKPTVDLASVYPPQDYFESAIIMHHDDVSFNDHQIIPFLSADCSPQVLTLQTQCLEQTLEALAILEGPAEHVEVEETNEKLESTAMNLSLAGACILGDSEGTTQLTPDPIADTACADTEAGADTEAVAVVTPDKSADNVCTNAEPEKASAETLDPTAASGSADAERKEAAAATTFYRSAGTVAAHTELEAAATSTAYTVFVNVEAEEAAAATPASTADTASADTESVGTVAVTVDPAADIVHANAEPEEEAAAITLDPTADTDTESEAAAAITADTVCANTEPEAATAVRLNISECTSSALTELPDAEAVAPTADTVCANTANEEAAANAESDLTVAAAIAVMEAELAAGAALERATEQVQTNTESATSWMETAEIALMAKADVDTAVFAAVEAAIRSKSITLSAAPTRFGTPSRPKPSLPLNFRVEPRSRAPMPTSTADDVAQIRTHHPSDAVHSALTTRGRPKLSVPAEVQAQRCKAIEHYNRREYGSSANCADIVKWREKILTCCDSFSSARSLRRALLRLVKLSAQRVTVAEALCALAECGGNPGDALRKVADADFRREAELVCRLIPVTQYVYTTVDCRSDPARSAPQSQSPVIASTSTESTQKDAILDLRDHHSYSHLTFPQLPHKRPPSSAKQVVFRPSIELSSTRQAWLPEITAPREVESFVLDMYSQNVEVLPPFFTLYTPLQSCVEDSSTLSSSNLLSPPSRTSMRWTSSLETFIDQTVASCEPPKMALMPLSKREAYKARQRELFAQSSKYASLVARKREHRKRIVDRQPPDFIL